MINRQISIGLIAGLLMVLPMTGWGETQNANPDQLPAVVGDDSAAAVAVNKGPGQYGYGARQHKGGCKHQTGGGKQCPKCRLGAHDGPGKAGAGGMKRLYAEHWESTLSDEQKAELDRIRVGFAKVQAPLKARARAVKVELVVLATADTLDPGAIEQKIAELAELKRERLAGKYAHIAAMRQVLTDDQRISFDMELLKKARHGTGKRGK